MKDEYDEKIKELIAEFTANKDDEQAKKEALAKEKQMRIEAEKRLKEQQILIERENAEREERLRLEELRFKKKKEETAALEEELEDILPKVDEANMIA